MIEEEKIKLNNAGEGGETEARESRTLSISSRNGLTYLLISKSIAEATLVAVLALTFYFTAFPPYYRGWGEVTAEQRIAGWSVNVAAPWDRVEVYLYIDGRFVASGTANLSRPDVSGAGFARDEWHGYVFDLPPLEKGEHEAHVYAIHKSAGGGHQTLQLLGKPIRFSV
ncbi:MAG: hypothetical protein H0X14_08305 [Acidobacteria bacterium]|nr:hypothetical protein [Acidobacteriota bacterium]